MLRHRNKSLLEEKVASTQQTYRYLEKLKELQHIKTISTTKGLNLESIMSLNILVPSQ